MRLMLDTGILGMVVHPRKYRDVQDWFDAAILRHQIIVPEIADYELRRKLLHQRLTRTIANLDHLETQLAGYLPLTTSAMRRAANLWAEARRAGYPTSADHALDGDVILSAQAQEAGALVVTENVAHISRFVEARRWSEIV